MADPVQLTDLDVITRYSIAVRKATADREELVETLRGDLAWLERGLRRTRPGDPVAESDDLAPAADSEDSAATEVDAAPAPAPSRRTPIRRMPAKVTAPRRSAAKKTAATKQSAAKKTTTRRSR